MGYPSLYKNFADEHMPSIADYGSGSGTGGLWVHDPALPEGFNNTLYTADWTVNKVFRHPLQPKGASYEVEQEQFLSIPRPSDLAMDARSNLYVASLAGGSFTYAGDTVGYVVRVSPVGAASEAPDLSMADEAQLLQALASANGEHRLQAQREILRRGAKRTAVRGLEQLILNRQQPAYARVAAMFTLKQLVGQRSHSVLQRAAADPAVKALALRALADHKGQLKGVPVALFVQSLSDSDFQVQLQAVTGLVRLDARGAADAILPLTASSDPALTHVAVNALVELDGATAALKGLDSGSPAVRTGALRALRRMHDPSTVAALIDRLGREQDPAMQRSVLLALARLCHREGPWSGDNWWGTRPSFAGPYFAPTAWEGSTEIKPILRQALLSASEAEFPGLVDEFVRNRVVPMGAKPLLLAVNTPGNPQRIEVIDALVGTSQLSPAAVPLLTRMDSQSAALHLAVAQLLADESTLSEQALPLAQKAALDPRLDPEVRSQLLAAVGRVPGQVGRNAAAEVFAQVNPADETDEALERAWRRYVGERRRTEDLDYFITLARTGQPAQRTLAYSVLVQAVRSDRAPQAVRDKVAPVIEAGWTDPASTPSLVQAITLMRVENQYAAKLQQHRSRARKK